MGSAYLKKRDLGSRHDEELTEPDSDDDEEEDEDESDDPLAQLTKLYKVPINITTTYGIRNRFFC